MDPNRKQTNKLEIFLVPLKRNFRIWDFCLIIKFDPYLETLPTFFFRLKVSQNRLRLAGWAQNWRPSWRG